MKYLIRGIVRAPLLICGTGGQTMYDKLVKRLRNRRICIQQSGSLDDFPLLAEAADAIEELNKPRWIPVTERLPQESDRYMVIAVEPWFGTVCTEIMKYRVNENLWVYDGRITESTVTHWMPLPEPPKGET